MKLAPAFTLAFAAALPTFAQDACIDCRKSTAITAIQCHQAARSDADKAACDRKGQEAVKACSEGACKGRAAGAPAGKAPPKPAAKAGEK